MAVNKDGGLQLQAGILKITAKREEVRVVEDAGDGKKQAAHIAQRAEHKLRALGASPEVDLRGMMTDEALLVLDRFLDSAVMGRLETVTVIHGKGTGAVPEGGPGPPETEQICQVLPPRPLWRGRGRRDGGGAEIGCRRGPGRPSVRKRGGEKAGRIGRFVNFPSIPRI